MKEETLGLDVGGVIIQRQKIFSTDEYLQTKAVLDSFNVLKQLIRKRFDKRVVLISKCEQRTEQIINNWLFKYEFYEITDTPRGKVHFCRDHDEKARFCEQFEITHFIDNKLEALTHLVTAVPNLYLFQPKAKEIARFVRALPHVHQVQSWQEIRDLLVPIQSVVDKLAAKEF